MYSCRNKLNPSSMWKAYGEKSTPYSLRSGVPFLVPDANTWKYVINSLKFRRSVLWNNLPVNLKECQSLLKFKPLLKQNGSLPCTCSARRIYKYFICPVVYILKLVFLIIDVTFFGWLFLIMTRNVPTLNKLKFIIRINQSIDQ